MSFYIEKIGRLRLNKQIPHVNETKMKKVCINVEYFRHSDFKRSDVEFRKPYLH